MRSTSRWVAALLALACLSIEGNAQVWGGARARQDSQPEPRPRRLRPEVRLDYLGARTQAVHAGAGVSIPAGTYARLGVAAGAGPGWADGRTFTSARVDATVRFLIDPFRRSRWGVSLGGGLSARDDDGDLRGLALVFADVEGPGTRGWIPFAGIGAGGGVRVSAGFRRAATTGR